MAEKSVFAVPLPHSLETLCEHSLIDWVTRILLFYREIETGQQHGSRSAPTVGRLDFLVPGWSL
jgi:hypothetical protein